MEELFSGTGSIFFSSSAFLSITGSFTDFVSSSTSDMEGLFFGTCSFFFSTLVFFSITGYFSDFVSTSLFSSAIFPTTGSLTDFVSSSMSGMKENFSPQLDHFQILIRPPCQAWRRFYQEHDPFSHQ